MTNKTLTALTRIQVKELNEIVNLEVEPNQIKIFDLDGQEKVVDILKYNLLKDIKIITEGKKENDFLLTEYRKHKSLHRITLLKRLNHVLDQVSAHLKVPKKELPFRLSHPAKRNFSALPRDSNSET